MTDGIALCCPRCDWQTEPGRRSRCPSHPDRQLELDYDIGAVRERFDPATQSRSDLWRYDPLLPVEADPVTLGEGWTELAEAPTTGNALGVDLGLKLEGANPTGAAKDRGSAVVATHARERDAGRIVCASTGNAAASVAAYAARASLDCSLFVPERLPDAKAVQPLVYDADLVTVSGGYADAYQRCRASASEPATVDRSAGASPYTPAGAQTLGFELAEQAPRADWIAVSMGNGGTLADIWRGLDLFSRAGYLADPPRLLGVQAAGCPTIHDRLHGSESGAEQPPGTCADSIDVDDPHRAEDARTALEESNGATITVSDPSIRDALGDLGAGEGVFVEPAGAAAVAGIETALERGLVDSGERVVAVLTGDGLKDTATALDAVGT
ncbi:threonine synthase [Halovenus sp. WSH3]|uniref:Threonine synthase n=1 Tax=Halovenus carboxidivorans TaxID=2692199 RepID=A0A6B0T5E0_9EURY|nr:threonine synthase [Halovenus carboxidivorans]MXR50773.1 threonine synthase [Halovenus carboxidivorans]